MSAIRVIETTIHEISLERFIDACSIVQLYELEMMISKILTRYEESQKIQEDQQLVKLPTAIEVFENFKNIINPS